jgi:hypothetical protein
MQTKNFIRGIEKIKQRRAGGTPDLKINAAGINLSW